MGMNMTEKILARHAGLLHVEPGQLITCQLDMVLANDITAPRKRCDGTAVDQGV